MSSRINVSNLNLQLMTFLIRELYQTIRWGTMPHSRKSNSGQPPIFPLRGTRTKALGLVAHISSGQWDLPVIDLVC